MEREILFYDIEVYSNDYFFVFLREDGSVHDIIVNTNKGLAKIFQTYTVVGYNNYHYDDFMTMHCMRGLTNPKDMKALNDAVIHDTLNKDEKMKYVWGYENLISTYDVSQQIDGTEVFKKWDDVEKKMVSVRFPPALKKIEANKGHNIHESGVSFDHPDKLTPEQLEECIQYCINDVLETIPIYQERISYFAAKNYTIDLLIAKGKEKEFNRNKLVRRTQSTLIAKLIGKLTPWEFDWSMIEPVVPKKVYEEWKSRIEDPTLEKKIISHDEFDMRIDFGYGGIHAFNNNHRNVKNVWHVDVASMYPSIIINMNIFGDATDEYKGYRQKRYDIKYEAERLYNGVNSGEIENTPELQAQIKAMQLEDLILKVYLLNAPFGCMNSVYSDLYNPNALYQVCLTGQAALYDLATRLYPYGEFCQLNTDGIYFLEEHEGWQVVMKQWEDDWGLALDRDLYKQGIYFHISRYIMVDSNDKIKTKGMNYKADKYYKANNAAIVDKCLVDYFVSGTKPLDTVLDNIDNAILFQYVTKIGRQYQLGTGDSDDTFVEMGQRVNRCFVTSDTNYQPLFKRKHSEKRKKNPETGKFEGTGEWYNSYSKLAGVPDNIVLHNEGLENGIDIPLDINFYVTEAERLIRELE